MANEKELSNPQNYDSTTALLVQVLWAIAVASYLATSLFAPDFFEQLVIGRWILSHHDLPREDLWTLLAQNRAWRPVSWLFALNLAWVESIAGELGLAFFKLSGFLLFALVAVFLFSHQACDKFFGTLIACIVCCAVLLNAVLSPELFAWSLFLASIGIFKCFSEQEKQSKRYLIALFLLGVLFANVSGFSLLALLVIALHAFTNLASEEVSKKNLLIAAGVFALSQFFTPYLGVQCLQIIHSAINQLSLDFYYQLNAGTVYDFPVAFLVLIILLLAVFWSKSPEGLRLSEVLALSLCTLIGLASSFVLPYAIILAGSSTAILWGRTNSERLGKLAEGFTILRSKLLGISPFGVLWLALCIVIVNVINIYRIPSSRVFLPQAEVDYLLENKPPFPLLHESSIGPYLVYRFSDARGEPLEKAAISPRAINLVPELGRYAIALERFGPDWRKFFDFIAPNTVLCRKASPMYAVLQSDAMWKLVFENGLLNGEADREDSRRQLPEEYIWAVFKKSNKKSHD